MERMNTTHLQLLETDGFVHIELMDRQGNIDRVVLSLTEWAYAKVCMAGAADYYPYFDDVNYLVQVTNHSVVVKYHPVHGECYTHIYTFPMQVILDQYPAQRIWNYDDCEQLAKNWHPA
jgi:hypothetical protein